jgi:hypothetical protein
MANDGTPTHKVINLRGVRWIENGRVAFFEAQRPGWGVLELATGTLLSSTGDQPAAWRYKDAAHTHAEYPTACAHRVPVAPTAPEATR